MPVELLGQLDWETIKGLGVITGMVFAVYMLGKIVKWQLDMIQTRDKNQMDRDDKRDALLVNMQLAISSNTDRLERLEYHVRERKGAPS